MKEEETCECIWQTDRLSLEIGAMMSSFKFRMLCKILAWILIVSTIFERPSGAHIYLSETQVTVASYIHNWTHAVVCLNLMLILKSEPDQLTC